MYWFLTALHHILWPWFTYNECSMVHCPWCTSVFPFPKLSDHTIAASTVSCAKQCPLPQKTCFKACGGIWKLCFYFSQAMSGFLILNYSSGCWTPLEKTHLQVKEITPYIKLHTIFLFNFHWNHACPSLKYFATPPVQNVSRSPTLSNIFSQHFPIFFLQHVSTLLLRTILPRFSQSSLPQSCFEPVSLDLFNNTASRPFPIISSRVHVASSLCTWCSRMIAEWCWITGFWCLSRSQHIGWNLWFLKEASAILGPGSSSFDSNIFFLL